MAITTRKSVDVLALYRDIGRKIKRERQRKRLSQDIVAVSIGMTRANVANLEAGKTRILLEHVYNAALLFRVPVSRLLP